jgi:hypothetical protein
MIREEGTLADYLDLKGGSGSVYRYAPGRGQLSPMGGNYAFVRELPGGRWELIYAGETENLFVGARARREEAEAAHGPLRLFTRLNISASVRRAEQEDIVSGYQPPMNVPAEV